jgi:hypothetical protein
MKRSRGLRLRAGFVMAVAGGASAQTSDKGMAAPSKPRNPGGRMASVGGAQFDRSSCGGHYRDPMGGHRSSRGGGSFEAGGGRQR